MKADKLTTEIGDIIENVWAKYGGDEWIDVAAARVVKHLRREFHEAMRDAIIAKWHENDYRSSWEIPCAVMAAEACWPFIEAAEGRGADSGGIVTEDDRAALVESIPVAVPTVAERWAIHNYERARQALNLAMGDLRRAGELCQQERVYWNGEDCRWMRVPIEGRNQALDVEAFDRPRGYAEPVAPTDSQEADQ